jgi:hypothetical protein
VDTTDAVRISSAWDSPGNAGCPTLGPVLAVGGKESTFPTDVGITHAVRISACRLATSKRALPAAFHPTQPAGRLALAQHEVLGRRHSLCSSVPPGTTGHSLHGTSSAQHTSRERIAFAPCHPEAAPAEGSHTCGHHRCRSDCFWWDSPGNQPHRGRDVFPGGLSRMRNDCPASAFIRVNLR